MAFVERSAENDLIMDQFVFFRGLIMTCFGQVEWFMAKILIEANAYPEYQTLNLDFSIQAETRAKKIRTLFQSDGRLHKYAHELLPLVDKIMTFAETRNFMAHGVCITTASENHGVLFRLKMFKRMTGGEDHEGKIDFTVDQLKSEAAAVSAATKDFISAVRTIWKEQGMNIFDVEF